MRKILALEPFLGGSHQNWLQGLQKHSQHSINILGLPDRFWKWRMLGAAVPLAQAFLKAQDTPDILLASDMLDLPSFLALSRKKSKSIPTVLFFHENQLTYPWSPKDSERKRSAYKHFGLINWRSALAADAVWFNSHYHRDSFLSALEPLLKSFPDAHCLDSIDLIREKSQVVYLGLDLSITVQAPPKEHILLWNHRWEYDKNPKAFYRLIKDLLKAKQRFKLLLLGAHLEVENEYYTQITREFSQLILPHSYQKTRKDYLALLGKATLLPVTSNQDFFGLSIIEAMAAGVTPLLPQRLTYPELLPPSAHSKYLYKGYQDLLKKTIQFLSHPPEHHPGCIQRAQSFDWAERIPEYDTLFSALSP